MTFPVVNLFPAQAIAGTESANCRQHLFLQALPSFILGLLLGIGEEQSPHECAQRGILLGGANPGDVDVIFDFGLFLLETGDIESAKEKFNRILEINPDFAPALFYLGEIAFNIQDYERAVELYNQALEKDRTLQGPCYRLAQHALMKGRKIETGAYLEFRSLDDCKLHAPDGALLATVTPQGETPVLQPGANRVEFTCESSGDVRPRSYVTIITAAKTPL